MTRELWAGCSENKMERPYVICHILTAIDGKIDGEFFAMPETLPALKKYGEIRSFYDCKATIYGTTTVAEGYSDGILTEPPTCEIVYPREDFIADKSAENYIISLDPKGVLKWSGGWLEKKNRPKAHVVEVLTDGVADGYISYLRGLGVSYIFAGKDNIDCGLLLKKLKAQLGLERVMLAGGGVTNQSFAAAGMIDELSLVIAPTADGDSGSASLFETGGFSAPSPKAYKLKAVEQGEGDVLWLRYLSI